MCCVCVCTQVEYFLQLSRPQNNTTGGDGTCNNSEQLALPPSLEPIFPESEDDLTSSREKEEGERERKEKEEEREGGGVRMVVEAHHAVQLLSLYRSLSRQFEQTDATFCIHGGVWKSESFFTARTS